MKLKCKLGAQCFGYVNTKTEPINIEKDKEYTLEKAYDEIAKVYYYNVIDEDKIITTLSEDELKIFFEVN